jgi:pimeloyl-ACP methyl ester carboxylesterase
MSRDFRSIQIRGRRVRYACEGEGTPVVVIDQGQGLSIERGFEQHPALGWTRIFQEIQESTRIIMHDRAGLGASDPAPGPRASAAMVEDLRAVLTAARARPPYVLVGHSVGGFNVRLFAARYPEEVAGVVLVDSSHPDQVPKIAGLLPAETPGESSSLRALRRTPDAALSSEAIDFRACAEEVRGIGSIGFKPLVVISQSPQALGPPGIPLATWERIRVAWAGLQDDLLGLSLLSRHVVATHAGHHVQAEEPDLVVDAILSVVREARATPRRLH